MRANVVPFVEINSFPTKIGRGCFFQRNTWINKSSEGQLHIGDRCYFGHGCQLNAFKSVKIENDVLISDNVYISDAEHRFNNDALPIRNQGIKMSPVVIMSGAWIGRNAVIMPGVVIGKNSVVGANSVVTKAVSDNTVVAGVPARVIRQL